VESSPALQIEANFPAATNCVQFEANRGTWCSKIRTQSPTANFRRASGEEIAGITNRSQFPRRNELRTIRSQSRHMVFENSNPIADGEFPARVG
jgi:hypothetical protein